MIDDDIVELLTDPDFVTEFTLKTASGYRENGKWIETLVSEVKEGVVQPTAAKDTQSLQEGDKTRASIKIYCSFEVSASNEAPPKLGDLIVWHKRTFRVAKAPDDWSQYGYWKAIAVEVEVDSKNG